MSMIEELNLDGFQVVHSEMFMQLPRKTEATCALFPTKMTFNKATLLNLHSCEYVRIEVNPQQKRILVVPVNSGDKDSIRWIKGKKDLYIRNFESKRFAGELYSTWGLEPEFNYRAKGRLVSVKGKVMMLFDFARSEIWQSRKV